MMDDNKALIIKAWETYQGLIKGFGEDCWKIRSFFVSVSVGVMSVGFSMDSSFVYFFNIVLVVVFCLLESGYRRLQIQCIEKSREIELSLNDMLTGDQDYRLPADGICTSLDIPSFMDLLCLFSLKRVMFWMPYLFVLIVSLALFVLNLTKSTMVRC